VEAELSTERSTGPTELPPAERAERVRRFRIISRERGADHYSVARDRGAATRDRDSHFRRLLLGADLIVAGSVLLAISYASATSAGLQPAAVLALPAFVLLAKMLGLYDRDELVLHKSTLEESPAVFQLVTLFVVFIWLGEAFFLNGAFTKPLFALLWVAMFASVLTARGFARWVAQRTAVPERCLVLGPPEAARRIDAKLSMRGPSGAQIVSREDLEDEHGHVHVSGRLADLVDRTGAERLILVPRATESDAVLDLIREAKALDVKTTLWPRFSEVLGSSVVTDDLYGISLLGMRRLGLSRSSQALKRSFDLTLSALALLAIAPLMLAIAIAIKLDSRGPVFYRQRRIGRDGRPFTMFKFRTMINGADELKAELHHLNEAEGLFKIADDPRVTRVGRVLRRSALDELPQLLNVLRGDMSLVGPRPLVIEDDARVVGRHRDRLCLLPGMTGDWQVMGAARIPLQEMVAIDYLYVANWSLWADMKCLLRTVPYMVRARGL
jgi:exopolysaccharide biosynthesis polyprenyl glycosylphosphotransferase